MSRKPTTEERLKKFFVEGADPLPSEEEITNEELARVIYESLTGFHERFDYVKKDPDDDDPYPEEVDDWSLFAFQILCCRFNWPFQDW